MTTSAAPGQHGDEHAPHGPKYDVNIEGVVHDWPSPGITPAGVRSLAGWPEGEQVLAVDMETNIETPVGENETIALKPGVGFGRKFRFKRGRL